MSLVLEFSNPVQAPVEESFIREVTARSLEKGENSLRVKDVSLEVSLVSREEIRNLNNRYRGKDVETDVLSFGEYDGREPLRAAMTAEIFLGQVFVCYDYVVDAAQEDGVSVGRELAYIVSHGVLHLLGYDHEEEMFSIQDEVSGRF